QGMPAGYRVARVYVDRSAEGRGVGGALAARLRDAVDAEATKVRNRMFDDDPRSLAIARHWGLEVEQHSLTSSMPIADTARPDPPAGVSLEDCPTLSFPDAGAVEAMLLASQTNPEAMRGLRFTLEGLRTFVSPTDTPVGVLARVSGRPAALSFGARRDEVLHFSYTGVGPTHRGRGLARLVKQHAHWRAATLGATVAVTDNEEHNTGIRHVNQRLGYRVDHGVFWLNADV
ncbi:MAG: hypothetical protein HOQ45_01430, partial [Nocardioidaceae bacterium]|nr:hypothetical protein [Nocardioidaceae bacterium]